MKRRKLIIFLKAWFGSAYAVKILIQIHSEIGRFCCYSPFQRNIYCKVINNYFSKNIKKSVQYFNKLSKTNTRVIFVLYNFLKMNGEKSELSLLDGYFENKKLIPIRKIDSSKEFYIDNVKTLSASDNIKNNIKVSVIITVYNCEALVAHAVMSIINQTYENIEIIVVNDGSTDNTLSILKSLKHEFPDIKLLSINNSGTYIARNVGLTYSRGDLITFHDADDWAFPQRIEEHIKIHEKNNDCSGTLSLLTRVTPEGYFYSKQIYPVDRNCMLSLMFSRDVFNRLGYFKKGRFGNDSEYYERIKKFSEGKIYSIDKVLTICAQRPNSLTTTSETSNEIGKNKKRMHQMKRWRKWYKLCKSKNKIPFVLFNADLMKIEEIL